MKKRLAILILAAMVLTSCGGNETVGGQETSAIETTVSMVEPQIQSVEEMTEIDGVLSVTKLTEFTSSESAYKVEFESDGLKRYAEIALPNDYAEKSYPSVLYFPDVGHGVDFLVDNFAKRDVIVVRLFSRGANGNEGVKDFCGADFADAEKLLSICSQYDFLSKGGIFTAGAGAGSTFALKLASEYPDQIVGCAVVDAICDYETFIEARGEDMKAMMLASIGCSEEELSTELAKRSPKSFYETIQASVLMFCYEESPLIPKEQSEMLKELLDENGCDTELQYLNPVYSDFNGTAFLKLIPWITRLSKNIK